MQLTNNDTVSITAASEGVRESGSEKKKNPLYKALSLTHPFLVIITAVTIVTPPPMWNENGTALIWTERERESGEQTLKYIIKSQYLSIHLHSPPRILIVILQPRCSHRLTSVNSHNQKQYKSILIQVCADAKHACHV